MTELELIERLAKRVPLQQGSLILGIGDDAAIYRPRGSHADLLFTTDMLIEGVHFRGTESPEYLGYKALARGLSDIAAMGGAPRFCLLSLAAKRLAERFVDGFFRGLLRLASQTDTVLAGGDTSTSRRTTIDIVVCGEVPRGRALLRTGARPGDDIYVSGLLGRAASRRYHDRPRPRLSLGQALRNRASACMDISDGLSLDLRRLCQASGVAAAVETIPVHPGATMEQALHGGEDYELLYTAPIRVPGHRIGTVVGGEPGAVTLHQVPLPPRAYEHFRAKH